MTQIGHYGHFFALCHLGSYLCIYKSKHCLARRTDAGILQRTPLLFHGPTKNFQIQLLYLQFGAACLTLVLHFLTQLLQLHTAGRIRKLGLAHLIGCTRSQTVQIALIAPVHLHAVQFHFGNPDLHIQVVQINLVVTQLLLQLITFHLFLVQQFLIIVFDALQIESQQRSAHLYRVPDTGIHFHNARAYRRSDTFFESRHYLTISADAGFDSAGIYCIKDQRRLLDTGLKLAADPKNRADQYSNTQNYGKRNLDAPFSDFNRRYRTIHIYVYFIIFTFHNNKNRAKNVKY